MNFLKKIFFLPALEWRANRRLDRASFYYEMSGIYARKKAIELAIAEDTKGIHIDRDNSRAYVCRGEHYYENGDYGSALADFETVINMDPDIRGLGYGSSRHIDALSDLDRARRGRDAVLAAEGANRAISETDSSRAAGKRTPIDRRTNDSSAATEGASGQAPVKLPLACSGALLTTVFAFPLGLWGRKWWRMTERHYKRAQAYHDWGEYNLAIAEYDAALGIDLEHILFSNPDLGYATHPSFLGFRQIRHSTYGGGPRGFNLPWCYIRRGLSYLGTGEYALAVADFDRASGFAYNYMYSVIGVCRRIADRQARKSKRISSLKPTTPRWEDLLSLADREAKRARSRVRLSNP